jgi:hypothetical protein
MNDSVARKSQTELKKLTPIVVLPMGISFRDFATIHLRVAFASGCRLLEQA